MGGRREIWQTANRTVVPALPFVMAITVGGERQLTASARQMLLGLPVGTVGAAAGAWLSHLRSVNDSHSALPAAF